MSIVPAQTLGRCEFRTPLGAGGMGEVWRTRAEKLNRDAAIRVLTATLSQNADQLRQFEQEA